MWHAVSARTDAKLLLGLKPGVTKREFEAKLGSNFLEDLFQEIPVELNDTFFVRARTPHSIGPGVVMCEVQEYSDLTYRVYDYDRMDSHGKPRQLHVEKALEVIQFDGPAVGKSPKIEWAADNASVSLLAACRYFETYRFRFKGHFVTESKSDVFHLVVFLDGSGEIRRESGQERYKRGECWFVPASLDHYELSTASETTFLRVYLPGASDLAALRGQLRQSGISEENICKVVFE
jgi:mannose-6-phosphate isomerase